MKRLIVVAIALVIATWLAWKPGGDHSLLPRWPLAHESELG
jgi:hypothetical protein